MVRLKAFFADRTILRITYFNSSMVRLKGRTFIIQQGYLKFQFQYGAIEGALKFRASSTLKKFQFQYGAIEGLC